MPKPIAGRLRNLWIELLHHRLIMAKPAACKNDSSSSDVVVASTYSANSPRRIGEQMLDAGLHCYIDGLPAYRGVKKRHEPCSFSFDAVAPFYVSALHSELEKPFGLELGA